MAVMKQAAHSHLVLSGKTKQHGKMPRAKNSKITANVIRVWHATNHAEKNTTST